MLTNLLALAAYLTLTAATTQNPATAAAAATPLLPTWGWAALATSRH